MAKSARHKKLRRQEKAKVQLKSGIRVVKKLQNEVKPEVKAKKIVVPEQLRQSSNQDALTTKRKQNLQVRTQPKNIIFMIFFYR